MRSVAFFSITETIFRSRRASATSDLLSLIRATANSPIALIDARHIKTLFDIRAASVFWAEKKRL
jgi:hypothetical protein